MSVEDFKQSVMDRWNASHPNGPCAGAETGWAIEYVPFFSTHWRSEVSNGLYHDRYHAIREAMTLPQYRSLDAACRIVRYEQKRPVKVEMVHDGRTFMQWITMWWRNAPCEFRGFWEK